MYLFTREYTNSLINEHTKMSKLQKKIKLYNYMPCIILTSKLQLVKTATHIYFQEISIFII